MIDLEAETRRMPRWEPSALAMFIRFTEAEVASKQALLEAARAVLQGKADDKAGV